MHDHSSHGHSHGGAETIEEAEALLRFTLQHNSSHEEELHELGHTLESLGQDEAAEEIWNSLEDSRRASEHIERAAAAIKK